MSHLTDRLVVACPVAGAEPVRIEIPADIQAVQARSPEEAAAWRAASRKAFLTHLSWGYRVAGLERDEDGRCFYPLVAA